MTRLTGHPRAGVAVLAATTAALAALAGCGGSTPAPSAPMAPTVPGAPTPSAQTAPGGAGATSAPAQGGGDVTKVVAAARTAAGALPGGQAFDIEHEQRGPDVVWEVKVASEGREFTVDVSEDGSQVLSQHRSDEVSDDVSTLSDATIDAVRAAELGAERHQGVLVEMEIDTDGATTVWQLDFRNPDGATSQIDIDARTGDTVREG